MCADDEFYPSNGLIYEVLVYSRALSELEIQARFDSMKKYFPEPPAPVEPYRVATGPFIEWQSPTSIKVSWTTEQPTASILEFAESQTRAKRYEDVRPKESHALVIANCPG